MNRSDMRTLGRIGQPLSGGTYRPRRRLRAPRWLLGTVVAALIGFVWVGATANRQVAAGGADTVVAHVPDRPEGSQVSRAGARSQAMTFARVEGLDLAVPHSKPLAVAFHEASRVEALGLTPVGRLLANDNATSFEAPADEKGPGYRVLSSRGRARPATSAVDVVVPLGDAVNAPVSGVVSAVTEYPLYGRVRDWRVEITPEGRPDLTVVVIHLLRPSVEVGDEVSAGASPLGVARLLPFSSHVDYVLDEKQPHAHIEVKPAVESEPIDPNQPALPAEEDDH